MVGDSFEGRRHCFQDIAEIAGFEHGCEGRRQHGDLQRIAQRPCEGCFAGPGRTAQQQFRRHVTPCEISLSPESEISLQVQRPNPRLPIATQRFDGEIFRGRRLLLSVGWLGLGHRQFGRPITLRAREPPEPFATPRLQLSRSAAALAAFLIFVALLRYGRCSQSREDGEDFLDRASRSQSKGKIIKPQRARLEVSGFHRHQRCFRRNIQAHVKKLGEQGAIDAASLQHQIGGGKQPWRKLQPCVFVGDEERHGFVQRRLGKRIADRLRRHLAKALAGHGHHSMRVAFVVTVATTQRPISKGIYEAQSEGHDQAFLKHLAHALLTLGDLCLQHDHGAGRRNTSRRLPRWGTVSPMALAIRSATAASAT